MGTVISLNDRRPAPDRARAEGRRLVPAAGSIQQALDRYRRELRLLRGRGWASGGNRPDGVIILDRVRPLRARRQVIGDLILRIKTLEAMLDLVQEGPQAVVRSGPARRLT